MALAFKVEVSAGKHNRKYCPVSFKLEKDSPILTKQQINPFEPGALSLWDENGEQVPVQCVDEEDCCGVNWIVKDLQAGSTRTYTFSSEKVDDASMGAAGDASMGTGVRLDQGEGRIEVNIGGSGFTAYVYDPAYAKPYIGPVIGPYGDGYTRLDLEIKEHPHQRSVWVAIGDVNGVDMWNEPAGMFGKQIHQQFSEISCGHVFGRLKADNLWTDFNGWKLIDESRTITFYNTPAEGRFIDMDIRFTANHGQAEFGATKEAGPLGIRIAESMTVTNGGQMLNSYGAVNESECWGKRAQWCDYSGMVNGHLLGIAAFDHHDNDCHPTHWHIRNYGLMAPNNFYFAGGVLLKPGQTMEFKYRLYFHEGDAAKAGVGECYHDYINPPAVKLL